MKKLTKKKIRRYSKKTKIRLIKKIADDYAIGIHTLSSICESYDVPDRTFRSWIYSIQKEINTEDTDKELAEVAAYWFKSLKIGESRNIERLKEKARCSLEKRVEGFYKNEVRHQYKFDSEKKEMVFLEKSTVTKKYYPPSDRAIEYILNMTEINKPEELKPIQDNDPLMTKMLQDISDEELWDLLLESEEAEKAVKKRFGRLFK